MLYVWWVLIDVQRVGCRIIENECGWTEMEHDAWWRMVDAMFV